MATLISPEIGALLIAAWALFAWRRLPTNPPQRSQQEVWDETGPEYLKGTGTIPPVGYDMPPRPLSPC